MSKKCSSCGYENEENAKFCLNCGNSFENSKKINSCPECGHDNDIGSNFCMVCGHSLANEENSNAKVNPINQEKVISQRNIPNEVNSIPPQKSDPNEVNSIPPQKSDPNEVNSIPPQGSNLNEVNCPYCGSMIPANAEKCRFCGEWVKKSPSKVYTPTDEDKSYTITIIVGYIISFFGGWFGFIIAFYLLTRQNKNAKMHGGIMIALAIIMVIVWLSIPFLILRTL